MIFTKMESLIPLLAIIFIAIIGIFYLWTYRKGLQDIIGIVIIVLSIIWIATYILEQSVESYLLKALFDKIQYTGSVLIPPGVFFLVAKFINFEKIFSIKYILAISAFPVATLLLVMTNEFHKLVWINAKLVLFDSFSVIVKEYNTLYFIFILYTSSLLITGIIITLINIIKSFIKLDGQNHWKKFFLLPYVLIPGLVILVKSLGFNSFPNITITPVVTIFGTLLIIILLNRTKISEIMPMAFKTVFENMNDGLVLLDRGGNVLKINTAFKKIFNTSANEIIGKPVNYLSAELNEKLDISLNDKELKIGNNGSSYFFDTKQSEIKSDSGKNLGRVIALRDITSIRRAEETIKYLGFHDKLTGLYNREYFDSELKRLHKSRQMPLTLVIGGLNGLKIINDAYGHTFGDKLLKKIADILRECFRIEDIVARWGGDEFSILLTNTSYTAALQIMDRVYEKCKKHSEATMILSISMGVSTKDGANKSIKEMLKEAEDKMYRHKLIENQSARSSIIKSLEVALKERDLETEEHTQRMKKYSLLFGEILELPDSKMDELSLLSTLHDIGKIGIPDQIVLKPGKLNEEEWQIMKKHPEIGYRIALSSADLAIIANSILHHHERWDGNGYPHGLANNEIPITSRIISIVDSYDAMTSDRPYRKAMSKEIVQDELYKNIGSQFDPELTNVFMNQLLLKNCITKF
jgi:diguanylate cyclase (GGDEF)-like protein/PAS domain S-box-containing protein